MAEFVPTVAPFINEQSRGRPYKFEPGKIFSPRPCKRQLATELPAICKTAVVEEIYQSTV